QGGTLFKRMTYQEGSLKIEERRRGPDVWVFRSRDSDATGKRIYRKHQLGDTLQYPNEAAARSALDAIRFTINSQSPRSNANRMTVKSLWEHYEREELPSKECSTQDAYRHYATKWIVPRWGSYMLSKVKTVDVERWMRQATVADGTRAKLKCLL